MKTFNIKHSYHTLVDKFVVCPIATFFILGCKWQKCYKTKKGTLTLGKKRSVDYTIGPYFNELVVLCPFYIRCKRVHGKI